MKSYFLLPLLVLLAACAGEPQQPKDPNALPASLVNNPYTAGKADQATLANMPQISFADTLHEFGALKEGDVVTYDFSFRNTGKSPLIISSVVGSCGCTVGNYPHEPVAAGGSSNISVRFSSAGKQGHQEKSVTVTSNAGRGTYMLYITAEVSAAN